MIKFVAHSSQISHLKIIKKKEMISLPPDPIRATTLLDNST